MRSRSLLELLKEHNLTFEIVAGGPMPFTAPSVEFRQYAHVADHYLVVRRGYRWAVEFWDRGYVCQVLEYEPDEARIVELFELVMDRQSYAYCPVIDLSKDQAELFLAPPPAPAPRRTSRPAPRRRGRATLRQHSERWLAHARKNAEAWREGLVVRAAWLTVGTVLGGLIGISA